MKRVLVCALCILLAPILVQADGRQKKRLPQSNSVTLPTRQRVSDTLTTASFLKGAAILQKIARQQRLLLQMSKAARSPDTIAETVTALSHAGYRKAELLGKTIPFQRAPNWTPTSRVPVLHRSGSTNILVNGKTADTVLVGETGTVTFSFAPGYISALFQLSYDVDGDGSLGPKDVPLSSKILLMDNDEHDSDPTVGKYTLRLEDSFSIVGIVGPLLFTLNNFESTTTALLVVQQKPSPVVVVIRTDPPVPTAVVRVYGADSYSEILMTDSLGTAMVSVNQSSSTLLTISVFDMFGSVGERIPPPTQSLPMPSDTTDVLFRFQEAAAFIEGVCLDSDGSPVADAQVSAWGSYDFALSAKSDSGGSFRLGVSSGPWWLYIQPPSSGYMGPSGSKYVYVTSNVTSHMTILLPRARATISGAIRYGTGGVGGVSVYANHDTLENEVLTEADGSYVLPVYTPEGTSAVYEVYPSTGRYVYYVKETIPVLVPADCTNIDFTLMKCSGGIQGKVVDNRTGYPIPGARVYCVGPGYFVCTTDDSGSYWAPLRDGIYSVYAEAKEYFPSPEISREVRGAFEECEIRLSRGGAISGVIRDKSGRPIQYANIFGYDTLNSMLVSSSSDPMGRYVLSPLRAGSYLVNACKEGYISLYYPSAEDPAGAKPVLVEEGLESPNIDFVLPKGGSIAGRVTDKAGVPLKDAFITVFDTNCYGRAYAFTNDSGAYSAGGLPTGMYRVYAGCYRYASHWYDNAETFVAATPVHVQSEQEASGINFSLPLGASISGYVKDPRGKPYPYAFVLVCDSLEQVLFIGMADTVGRYEILGLSQGTYKVSATGDFRTQWFDHKDSFAAADTIHLREEEKRDNIDFEPLHLAGIYGTVTDSSSGGPIENAMVSATSDSGEFFWTTTNYGSGDYALRMGEGRYAVRVEYQDTTHACRQYFTSRGAALLLNDAGRLDLSSDGMPQIIDFRIAEDAKETRIVSSPINLTVTNRGIIGNDWDTTKPSGRWPTAQSKNYLFESDFWAGGDFGGAERTFGRLYYFTPGAWRAAANFAQEMSDSGQSMQTAYYNTDYTSWWSGMSVVVRQEVISWQGVDYVLCRQNLYYDAPTSCGMPQITNLHAGLFADFDISNDAIHDLVKVDTSCGLIYVCDGTGTDSTCMGVCLLGAEHARLMWWPSNMDNDLWTEQARLQLLASDRGVSIPDTLEDYRVLVSSGPYTLNAGDSVHVAMAFVAGYGKDAIVAAAKAARQRYASEVTSTNGGIHDVLPAAFALNQNYPNPFNPTTVISGQLSADSRLRLVVYDVLGRQVAVLADGRFPAGKYSFTFDGTRLASGVYFYRLDAGNYTATRKMTIVK